MENEQQFKELFHQLDKDQDGEINHEEFGELVVQLGKEHIYPGTIKKVAHYSFR